MRIADQARFWLYDHNAGTWMEVQSLTSAHHTFTPSQETLELELISAWELADFTLSPESYYGVVVVYPHGYVGEFLFSTPDDVEHYVALEDQEDSRGLPRQRWHLTRVSERDLGDCPVPPVHDAPRVAPVGPLPGLVPV